MDENDGDDLMPQVFAIDGDSDEFDMDIPPTSGEEFLRRVKSEARSQPLVLVAELDPAKYSHKQTIGVKATDMESVLTAPSGYDSSTEWQLKQAADFCDTRQKIARYKARLKKGEVKNESTMKLPYANSVEQWCTLCFGRLQTKSLEDPQGEDKSAETAESSYPDNGILPLLSIIMRMDQPTVVQVLGYHVNWMEATGFTHQQGRWFYALLSLLEKPLDPEACSLTRRLARLCSQLRATLESPTDDRLNALNLLICIVAQYFDQKDLIEQPA